MASSLDDVLGAEAEDSQICRIEITEAQLRLKHMLSMIPSSSNHLFSGAPSFSINSTDNNSTDDIANDIHCSRLASSIAVSSILLSSNSTRSISNGKSVIL